MRKIRDKLLKRQAEKTLNKAIGKPPEDSEKEDESRDSRGSSTSKETIRSTATSVATTDTKPSKGKFKRLKAKFGKKGSSSESSKSTGSGTDDDLSSSDDDINASGLKTEKWDENFGKSTFVDTDKKMSWHVLVRIIEGRDLMAGALRIRASIDGTTKATRACSEGVPKWRQNLTFTQKQVSLEKLAAETLTIKVSRVGRVRDHVEGVFSVLLSAIIHSPNRAIVSRWIALRSPFDDEDDSQGEACGFLKVSFCVYNNNDALPHMNDDLACEQIWSGAQLDQYSLRIRAFRVHHLAEELRDRVANNTKKKPIQFFVRVHLGSRHVDSELRQMDMYERLEFREETINIEQELFIPIDWPTVIQKLRFELYLKQGRRKRCLGQASVPMRSLYEPGETGFMPTFGPTFVNFYGHEVFEHLKWRQEKQVIAEDVGSKYLARLLLSVDSVEFMGDSCQIADIPFGPVANSKQFEDINHYKVFCSFSACNQINPLYASLPISFHLSIGDHGSTQPKSTVYRSCTFSSMPDTDHHKYFFMPWGNYRPMADVSCLWEAVEHRMERYNALQKMVMMLDDMLIAVARGGPPAEIASCAIEALDHADEMISRLCQRPTSDNLRSELDRNWESVRCNLLSTTMKELDDFRFETSGTQEEAAEKAVRWLTRMRDTMQRVAADVQISLPAIVIKMVAGEKVVGFVKINPADVFCHENDALAGRWCGELKAYHLKWPTKIDRHSRKEEYPAVLHARLWFGRRADARFAWNDVIAPAEIKHYLEVYKYERKSKVNREWKQWSGPLWSDEHGKLDMEATAIRETVGWDHVGNWVSRTSHDMWITTDTGRPTTIDRVYQVEQRVDGEWKHMAYTDYYGEESEMDMKKAPNGWEYESEKWVQDKHINNGDHNGWIYALHPVFWGDNETTDKTARPDHQYRRRCISRKRRHVQYSKELETIANYEQSLGDVGKYEYAANFNAAWHVDDVADASVRRRRFLVEVQRDDFSKGQEHINFFLPRIYEVHHVTTTWQLRCYLLWAKDLLPIVKNSSHAFVRITFLTRAQQTMVVANSQNPIWCETLIFDKVPIPGGKQQITVNPPTIIVEVRGERTDDCDLFLGRFEIQPTVIVSPNSSRAQPRWNTLCFPKGKTRGAILGAFELFYVEPKKDTLPLVPMKKQNAEDRFEVPAELRPKFERFGVQFLCWGVRNLSRHHLLTVKRPLLEILLGDAEAHSDALSNAAKNPNFDRPLISIDEVSLPSTLDLCPPMVVNMFDMRAFHRRPLVGVCHISNFTRYIRPPPKKKQNSKEPNPESFRKLIEDEEYYLGQTYIIPSIQREGEPRIDWWSKYYASQKMHGKAPGFEEYGLEHLAIFKHELEQVNGYNGFTDFLDTFTFVKSSQGNFDDPEEKEKTGELKGKLFITRLGKDKMELLKPPGVEFEGLTKCLVRVYAVEAAGLQSVRRSGIVDSYVVVKCGKQKVKRKKAYRADTVEPVFGECIEFEVTIPLEKDLTISLMDRRKLLPDEEIGSTTIDLENRLLTKWRATVGFSKQYTIHGELAWRDQQNPLAALERYCKKMLIPPPVQLKKEKDYGLKVLDVEFWYSELAKVWENEDKYFAPKVMEKKEGLVKTEQPTASKERLKGAGSDRSDDDGEEKAESKKSKRVIRDQPRGDEDDEEMRPEKAEKKKGTMEKLTAFGDGLLTRKSTTLTRNQKKQPTTEEILQKRAEQRKTLLGRPLQCVALHILNMMSVGSIPAAVDISPREPEHYQLRAAVFNVTSAIAVRRSFGEPSSDLYVKVFVNGMQKSDKTDVHYRSLDGDAEFNWRFVIDVDFNPWERKVVAYRKTRLFRKPREELVEPFVIVQLWDKRKFRHDLLLGEITLDMLEFLDGLNSPSQVKRYIHRRKNQGCCSCSRRCCAIRCCLFCVKTRCGCKIRKTEKKPLPIPPRYYAPKDQDSFNLFDVSTVRGWWPMLNLDPPVVEKEITPKDKAARQKKDDDYRDEGGIEPFLMGLVEMEMSILPLEEALADPVGKKRKKPNQNPYLPKPHRSKWNFFWITSRIKPCARWCWHKCGIQILIWTIVILLVAILLYALISNWPVILLNIIRSF